MEIAQVGNNTVTACPCCDALIGVKGMYAHAKLQELIEAHRSESNRCDTYFRELPTLEDLQRIVGPAFAKADAERQQRIDNNPDNGKAGFWRVSGLRHEARTVATSAAQAIAKCADEVDPSWEMPEAEFIGEELPDVF